MPVAEALASGCFVIGYSGLGGRELFDLTSSYGTSIEIQVGDWSAFIEKIHNVSLSFVHNESKSIANLALSSKAVRSTYTLSAMRQSASHALQKIEKAVFCL